MSLRYRKTKKLFYDTFLYKVALSTPMAAAFRGNNLSATRDTLENERELMVRLKVDNRLVGSNWNRTVVRLSDVERDIVAVTLFEGITPNHIRVEGSNLSFYSNDASMLDTLETLYGWDCREVWQPEDDKVRDFLLANPKTIMRPEYSHKYKVTVNPIDDSSGFKGWASQLPKLKVMRHNYRLGGYFYVADTKTLSLCHLFLGDRIRRVDELRTVSEI